MEQFIQKRRITSEKIDPIPCLDYWDSTSLLMMINIFLNLLKIQIQKKVYLILAQDMELF